MEKPIVQIDNWQMENNYLWGNVLNHPTCYQGEFVRTSPIVNKDLSKNFVETVNTIYELKIPSVAQW